ATAVTPSTSGMCRSITIASGRSSSASSIAARPLLALPTTASSGCRSISGTSDSTKGRSSSARRTRMVPLPASSSLIRREASLAGQVVQPPRQTIAVIGAALDLGAGRRGVDMGPSAIRYAGLDARLTELGHTCVDRGNVETAVAEATSHGDDRVRFLPQIKDTCRRTAALVADAVQIGRATCRQWVDRIEM